MPILESSQPVNMSQREIAVVMSQAISKTGLVVPSAKYRNDVDGIQIDPIWIEEKVTNPKLAVRLQFMTNEQFGVTLNIEVDEFAADPQGYAKQLFDNLAMTMRNVKRRRNHKREESAKLYDLVTKGIAANG